MVMSKKVGYMLPELKKAKAEDADLAIFSTWQVVKIHTQGPKVTAIGCGMKREGCLEET